jgi:hypothetical protein
MNVTEQRNHAKELLDRMDDEFFAAVYQLMETYVSKQESQILGYTVRGEAITVGQFLEQAEEQVRRVKAGEGISVEELRKQSDEWLARTR